MVTEKSTFADQCIICLHCIYSCPAKAIKVKNIPILKRGFYPGSPGKKNARHRIGTHRKMQQGAFVERCKKIFT